MSSAHGLTVVGDGEGVSLGASLMEWFPWWMWRVREVAELNEQVQCGFGQKVMVYLVELFGYGDEGCWSGTCGRGHEKV